MDETKVDIDLINGTPVCKVEGDEFLPVQGMTFVQQIEQFFNKQGGKASSPFGDVMLNKKGVKADKNHGMSRIKAATFAAVKDVLEKGKIILPLDYHKVHNKKELTGMVAAPILVGEDRYICVVEVIKNLKEQRLYVHEAFLTKNLQEVVASSHVRDSNDATSRQPQGEVANVLINHLKNNTGVSGSGKSQLTDNNKTDINCSKNMNKKNTIRLTESDLKRVISESVKKVLRERYEDESNNFGERVKDIMRCVLHDIKTAESRLYSVANSRNKGIHEDDDTMAAYNVLHDCISIFRKNGFDLNVMNGRGTRSSEILRNTGMSRAEALRQKEDEDYWNDGGDISY